MQGPYSKPSLAGSSSPVGAREREGNRQAESLDAESPYAEGVAHASPGQRRPGSFFSPPPWREMRREQRTRTLRTGALELQARPYLGLRPLTQKPVAAAKKRPRWCARSRSLSHWLACVDDTTPAASPWAAISCNAKTWFAIV